MELLLSLARAIAGDFSNKEQSFADPKTFAHIRVFFRPLPYSFFDGIGFYSEQTYDYDLWSPYRQGVHRFVEQDGQVYVENYGLKDGIVYAGAGRDLNILKTITPNVIERRYNCSMIFMREGNVWKGSVEGKQCLIPRDGRQTYLISEVELTNTTFVSWDRGLDVNTQEQVWGSAAGPLRFTKIQSYAHEVFVANVT